MRLRIRPSKPDSAELAADVSQAGGRVIIGLKSRAAARVWDSGELAALTHGEAIAAIEALEREGIRIRKVFAGAHAAVAATVSPAELSALLKFPFVDYVEPSIPAVVQSTQDTSWAVWGVKAPQAWRARNGNRGEGATVTMIDMDVNQSHFLNGDGPASMTAQGCLFASDPAYAFDPPTCWTSANHGAHVAGLINGRDNTIGWIGVAPGLASFRSFRVCFAAYNSNDCPLDFIVDGLDWALANNVPRHIVNISMGLCRNFTIVQSRIQSLVAAGILVVASAGNRYSDDQDCPPVFAPDIAIHEVKYPARYPGVLAVSGVMSDITQPVLGPRPTTSSSPGGQDPGNCITNPSSCAAQGGACNGYGARYGPEVRLVAPFSGTSMIGNGDYGPLCGTSMSAALVSGVAAIAWTRFPTYTATQIQNHIVWNGVALGGVFGTIRSADASNSSQQPGPLSVSITGPQTIAVEGPHSWAASVTWGQSPVFTWSVSDTEHGPFTVVGNASTYVQFVGAGPPPEFWLRLQVSDLGATAATQIRVVNNAQNPCYPYVCVRAGTTPP